MRTAIPLSIGPLHFIGIGGIGMSGIAEILCSIGYRVQGSDVLDSANVSRLRNQGIPITIGHRAENLGQAQVVVYSSAVAADNPEMVESTARGLPCVRRAEMLAELMRLKWSIAIAGTHGKTTTTSLVAILLEAADLDPTVINGGIIHAYGTNARLGLGEWMVVETDESDGSFMSLSATVAIVTNIDREHMEFYGSIENLRDAFNRFVANIPFYGFAVLCIDHPEVQAMVGRQLNRRVVTYGLSPQAEVRAVNLRHGEQSTIFDVIIDDRDGVSAQGGEDGKLVIEQIELPMIGVYNVRNTLAAIATAWRLGIDPAIMRRALSQFSGVSRRFTDVGEGAGIRVIDDYAHHPVEIACVLEAARARMKDGRLLVVFQPHRYSRVRELFDEFCTAFNDADQVFVSDIYAAGEEPLPGVNRHWLVEGIRQHGHRSVVVIEDADKLAEQIFRTARPGDMVLCLGAGTVSQWAGKLPAELARLAG